MTDRPSPTEAGTPDVDVHVLPLGKKKGDEAFVDGYRRKGPEGLTRELVVLEVDEKGAPKVADKVRQLLEKKLTAFVVDMTQVPALEGATLKEFVRAKKLADEKGGYFSIAGAKDAVAGLLKVMGLEKELASHVNVATAIEQFKWHLQTQVAGKTGDPAPAASPPAAPSPGPRFVTGEMVAARPEGRLAVEQVDGDFLFYPPGKKPAKKDMAGDTMMLALSVRPNNLSGLAEEVRRAVAAGTNRILANLFELGAAGKEAGAQLAAAVKAAEEKKARVVFSGASPETQQAMAAAGITVAGCTFESEVAAAEQIAVELLEQKQKKGVRLKRIQGEIDVKAPPPAALTASPPAAQAGSEKKPAKTMQMAAPVFDEEPEERKPTKTMQMAVPKFEEDADAERKPGKTMQMATPKFDEDDEGERKPGKTQMYASPQFDEDQEERKPGKTAQMAVPKFDEDDEGPRKPGKTQTYAAPKFDEDEEERGPGNTQVVEAPMFFEEGDISSASKKKADASPVQKSKTDPERPAMKPEGKAKTDPERPAMKADTKGKTDPERPAAGFQEMKTQALSGLTKEEALRLAAEATGKSAPTQKAKTDAPRPAVAPPPKGGTQPLMAAAPPPPPPPPPKAKTEPMRAAAPAGMQEMKTQAISGLTKEEALRLAAEAAGKPVPAAKPSEGPRPQKTEQMKAFVPADVPSKAEETAPQKTAVMKAFTPTDEAKPAPGGDVRVMKTEAMSGLTKEEALRLAAEASGKAASKAAPKPPSKPEIKSQKTEVMQAAPAEGSVSQAAKTEMLAGLTKEEALRLAAEAAGKPLPPQAQKAKTDPTRPAASTAPQKTEQLKAFDPGAAERSDMRGSKTEAMPGLTKEEALKLAGGEAAGSKSGRQAPPKGGGTAPMMAAFPAEPQKKSDQQSMKTEAMPGLTRAEAEKLAKSAGKADVQESKTDRMAGMKKDDAKREVDRIQFQDSKTQALPGLSREEAEREAKTERELKAEKPPGDQGNGDAREAEPKKSPTLAIVGVVAVILAVAAFFAFGPSAAPPAQVDAKKLEAAEKKIEAALLDSLDLEGN